MEFSFFITDNKSGYKTTEKWLSNNQPELYSKIIEYNKNIPLVLSFKEKIWFYYNNLIERPRCKTCGSEIKFRERFDKPYGEFCSLNCINSNKEEMVLRQKKTFNKKYGVDFYPQHNDFITKQKETKLKRYGDENYNNIEKTKQTKKEKYGDENYVNNQKYKLTCLKKYNVDNYSKSNSYKTKLKNKFISLYPTINFIDVGKNFVVIKCSECGEESKITKQLLYERNKRNHDVCTTCNPIGQSSRSTYENEISDFLKSNGIEHTKSNRTILQKKELDIYIEKNKIAIEINGLYWHNELFLSNDYHLNKTIECKKMNIDLIHIFEDEWVYKKEIVKSIILNKIGKTKNVIFGRKCEIKEIDTKTSNTFLEENHIQGKVNSKVKIGLFYNNQLVSVMTFSKGRIIMGGKKNEWELNRFVSKLNTSVIGAAGKLFKYFLKHYQPEKVVSYSDIRIFNGNMYEKLGFKYKNQSPPNYWYVLNDLRYYRFNFRKSILIKEGFDKNKTEKQIMFERKIYRIYDCGNIRWEWTK